MPNSRGLVVPNWRDRTHRVVQETVRFFSLWVTGPPDVLLEPMVCIRKPFKPVVRVQRPRKPTLPVAVHSRPSLTPCQLLFFFLLFADRSPGYIA